jgi:putative two-component system response regulator
MRALMVDDDELSLELLEGILSELGYEVSRASNGMEALAVLRKEPIHLVITDWDMPEMNGLELCRAIREEDFDGYVFIIMLTGRDGGKQRIEGLHGGADAFLCKPLNPDELLVSLKTAERILGLETRDLAMFALAKLSESRDPETGAHIERVQSYARLLAQYLSTTERFRGVINTEFVRLIYQTSPLHDIGKVGIPDSVLLKPGKLDEQELTIMRTHASLGAQTLEASLQRFPNVQFLQMARDIALYHHERWDGTGYPNGLSGEKIPLSARIVALADVYDALTSRRVYREAMTHSQAKLLILRERDAHFDPDVVDAFIQVEKQFISVRERFRDDEQEQSAAARKRDAAAGVAAAAARTTRSHDGALVVDDDPIVREMLIHFLNSRGLECLACGDGREALELLEVHNPRIIISDWEMPGVDGLEFCRRIRARPGTEHVHFIMLTVHTGKEELQRAFDAGVDDFLAKPFNDAELMARLHTGIRAIALYDELSRQHRGSRQLNEQLTTFNRRLEKLAITDDLTGLYNRRQAMHRLEEHWSLCERYQRPVAVVSLDIDHFKQINDQHGHACGDTVLRTVADILRMCVRSTDTVCRIGGEEFLIVLPYQTQQEAEICAQRCRLAVAQQPFIYEGRPLRATVSAGVASRRPDMQQCLDLLRESDEALYAAKRAGRNTVCCARNDSTIERATSVA